MFVLKLPLIVSQRDARRLNSSFEVARLIYNSFLRECERRRKLYVNHPASLQARELKGEANKKARIKLYKEATKETGFYFRSAASKYELDDSLEQYLHQVILGQSYLSGHLGRHEATELGKRAFDASMKVVKRVADKVHYKRKGRDFIRSVAGTSLSSGLTWRDDKLRWSVQRVVRFLLEPQAWCFEDEKNKALLAQYAAEEKAGVPNKDRCFGRVRLVRKLIHGEWRFLAYLVATGNPVHKAKHLLGTGKIGIDLGPSTIAYVAESGTDAAGLLKFCSELDDVTAMERCLARKLDRQRRANNPDNYNENGTAKKGCKVWKTSTRMRQTQSRLAEVRRKQAEYRRCLHGRLSNILRSLGDYVLLEDLSYKSWQRGNYGKSVGAHAPGMFVSLLKQKFAFTNGMVDELNARVLRLSQRCPNCGNVKKKKLSERKHDCECGFAMQRDLVSALLAICVDNDGTTVQADRAKQLCQERGPLLRAVWNKTEAGGA